MQPSANAVGSDTAPLKKEPNPFPLISLSKSDTLSTFLLSENVDD